MKGFTLAACAAVALSASAVGQMQLREGFDVSNKEVRSEQMSVRMGLDKLSKATVERLEGASRAKRIAPAGVPGDIEGDYIVTIGDYYFEDSVGEFEDAATITVDDGIAWIECEYFMTDIPAVYNAETATLAFQVLPLGKAGDYYARLEPFTWSQAGGVVAGNYTVSFNGNEGTITFPADHGIMWCAYSDEDYSELVGRYDIFDIISLVKYDPNADPNEGWKSLGNAKFADGWGLPLIGVDQTNSENWVEVELQQNEDNENVYRLVNPYKGDHPLASYNTSVQNGYIQFDVTDPDHVVFATVDAGLSVAEAGVSKFYCMNTLTGLMGAYGLDAATVRSVLGDEIPYTTFKNGVLTLSSSYEADEDGNMDWNNDACFGIQGATYGQYGWVDEDGASANMMTQIFFPGASEENGVVGVNAAAANAPVKYFNLQGIAVTNPAKGDVVIRVEGENVSKMLVK